MRRTLGLATAAVLAAGTLGLQAAANGQVTHRPGVAAAAITALQHHPAAARATDGQAFRVIDVITDADGATHVRLQRTVDGIPVLGGDLVVHRGPGAAWEGVSQTLRAPVDVSTRPSVAASTATAHALAPSKVTRAISGLHSTTAPRLVIDATGAHPRLAWEVLSGGTQQDGTPSRLATYVDAHSGRVLRTEQQIETVDGSGQTLYSGTVPLSVTKSGSTYQLKNDGVRGNTYTTDMKNKSDSYACQLFGINCATGTLITSSTTTFGNGSNSNRATAGADAQYGSNETWDFYKQTFGRDGIFGNGQGSYNRVHYGNGYVNAFWDGTKMTYGDGDGSSYGPLVSLDVAGHEMSHGVTENTAGLTYSGESGGLNESTSDIFGTMVEFFANNANDPGDYLIGEQFDLKNHLGFRRMDDPASDGSSFNCWSSTAGSADVHYSSGIGNHFFYLLSEGSGAKTLNGVSYDSPTCDGSTVTGIGRDAAAAIWYRALTVYMTSSTDYSGARSATLSAAKDLYGSGSTQYAAVAAAWSAVNVS
ncbi:M4 family metallopeptidase [Nocardioides panaciterrulae]|uniref:Neutral metalloproteinase n=1 Tax=Nocardioides panaciterrulae TaxID=661492 RepID=A0A7Y9E7K4_9ACTN|nr:M4 family metallopeptidase [Nocardioides panaciterrulae]NYD42346.1 Zn-dependent metalloprotease [Nocardioides panaciterrulae]